ncbi:GNAT family N-acetyltransferase [Endothiovibrio diazotrophicus]
MTDSATAQSSLAFAFDSSVALQVLAGNLPAALLAEAGEISGRVGDAVSEALFAALPPPPARILLVGIEGAGWLAPLTRRGHEVVWLVPEGVESPLVEGLAAGQLRRGGYETFEETRGHFLAVLLHDAARHVDILRLFDRAERLLDPGGRVVILDEVERFRDAEEGGALHLLAQLQAAAERCGFAPGGEAEFSDDVVAYLERQLSALEGLPPDDRTERFRAACLTRREAYAQGRRAYRLLRFDKQRTPTWRVTRIGEADAPAVRELFREVFGSEMSADFWRWKYRGGLAGAAATGVWADGRLVAHYGGMGREVLLRGEPARVVQIGDVMVSPEQRGILTRKGPFFLSTATFLEEYIGYGNPYLLGFGFPSRRHLVLARRLGLYAEVGKVIAVRWPALHARPRLGSRVRALDPHGAGFERCVAGLWAAMRRDLSEAIVGVRDAAQLRYRYVSHPDHDYTLWLVSGRLTGRPLGIVVLRRVGESMELLDLVAPLARMPLLVFHARRLAAEAGAQDLFCWITAPFAERLGPGGTQEEIDVYVPANVWSAGPPPEVAEGRWWLTSGDTDFH